MKSVLALLIFFLGACIPASAEAAETPSAFSLWEQFLEKFVNEAGEVDYGAVKEDPSLLEAYLTELRKADLQMTDMPFGRETQLATWLNAYHAGVIAQVVKHYPVKSVQEIPGFWENKILQVGPHYFGLNQIRKNILMSDFHDEKIHTALACGARGCPRLSREAFTPERVEGQLFLRTKAFVNDPAYNPIVPGKKRLVLSPLFKWYQKDFRLDFGAEDDDFKFSRDEAAVLAFLVHYLDDLEAIRYLEERNYKINYPAFNWSLNDWRPGTG